MGIEATLVAVVVGLVAGGLAQYVMKGGGYGLVGDVMLGVGGSVVGGWLFHMLGGTAGAGWFATIAVAFVGAVSLICAQRLIFQVRA